MDSQIVYRGFTKKHFKRGGMMKSESMEIHKKKAPKSVKAAVLTLSDSKYRDLQSSKDTDLSGRLIMDSIKEKNQLVHYKVIPDDAELLISSIEEMIMNINPDLDTKASIILNAIYLANIFEIEEPKVAVTTAVELANPKMPSTIDASVLAKMSQRGQFSGKIIDGPFALDNAISPRAAKHKGITGPVAGNADIIIVPSIEAGNMIIL